LSWRQRRSDPRAPPGARRPRSVPPCAPASAPTRNATSPSRSPPAGPAARAAARPVATAPIAAPPEAATGDTHAAYAPNPWVETERDRLSTFAADVDTASYTYSRRAIDGGALPPAAAVRVEEFVNAFPYAFGAPRKGSPFAVVMDAAPSPFDPRHHVVRVGVATPGKPLSQRAPMNLVFLVDVSGSMDSGRQARPRQAVAAHAGGVARRRRHGLARDLRRLDRGGAAGDQRRRAPRDPGGDRSAARRRLDRDGLGPRAGLPAGAGAARRPRPSAVG
jgi:hypothetical protein